ncbi:N4-gp56 family major capsid protein [Macrococcus capreoli]|uniref:N4-gp56 family major capsid protein n=1 Tax=Macrococcus capreoli TaxID=2982690 RepID=UPI003EE6C29F
MTQTKVVDLVNPEVMAGAISAKLPNKIVFAKYARIDNTLKGLPGDTITRPKYAYIGPADELTEGVPMDPVKMSMTTTNVTIKEAGKAVEVTEKAILVNVDGTVEEAENQLTLSMADKIDIDYVAALRTAKLTSATPATTATGIIDAIKVFNSENKDDQYVLFINPADYAELTKSFFTAGGAIQDRALTKGQVSEIVGVSDIEVTRRVNVGEQFIQRVNAVEICWKKEVEVRKDYDVLKRTLILAANDYYAVNLYDDNGVVKIGAPAGA